MKRRDIPKSLKQLITSDWIAIPKSPFWVTVATITPEIADRILEKHNNNNRPISKPHVRNLSREFEMGRFKLTGETVIFNEKC